MHLQPYFSGYSGVGFASVSAVAHTGVPVVKAETANRKGKGEAGQAKTREAKLGCVFTQTTVDEKGHPKRDEDSTSHFSPGKAGGLIKP